MAQGPLTLFVLATIATTIFLGCGAGSGNSSQPSAERQAQEQKAGGANPSEERLGHPALGSAEAPVVMTEYSDYQ